MNVRKLFLVLGGAALALGVFGIRSARADLVFTERLTAPVSGIFDADNCIGQPVYFEGTWRIIVHEIIDEIGGVHTELAEDENLALLNLVTGETGVGLLVNHDSFTTTLGMPYKDTFGGTIANIFPGPSNNDFVAQSMGHVMLDANGQITLWVSNVTSGCR